MQLPWDRNYIKISFYLALSLSIFYIIKTLIDTYAFIITDADKIAGGIILLLKDAANILSPLIIALAISYLLSPIVTFIHKKTKITSAVQAVSLLYAFVAAVFALLTAYIIISGSSYQFFSEKIVEFRMQLNDMLVLIKLNFIEWGMEGAVHYLDGLTGRISFPERNGEIAGTISYAARFFVDLFIGLVAAFYILVNKKKLVENTVKNLELILEKEAYRKLKIVFLDMHKVFSGYIRGQATDALIISVLIGAGLKLIGVEFAFVIGIITGFTNLVPYLGAAVGFVLSVVMAFITGPPILAFYAAVYVIFIQQIDSIVIIPKIVGRKVDLSPVVVILAVVIGGRLFGFFGMVFAVPVCAVLKIWLMRLMETLAIKRKNKYNVHIRKKL